MSARGRLAMVGLLAVGAAVVGCMDAVAPREVGSSPTAIFDEVWREYDRHYAFFDSRGVDWGAVRARYRPQAASGGEALYAALCAMLDTLRDHHAVLFAGGRACGSPPLQRTYPYDPIAVFGYLAGSYRRSAGTQIVSGTIRGAAYVRLPRFADAAQVAEFDAVLAALPATFGLIFDLRGNTGGNSATGDAIAGRFTDRDRPYVLVRYRDGPGHEEFGAPITGVIHPRGPLYRAPVVLLVDRSVGSAGEDFVMAMRTIPGVVLLGDTTSGTASNPLWRELPNGWSYWVPQSRETTLDGITPTADGGIPPTRVVRTTAADSTQGIDLLLDSAVARLVP